MLLLVLADNYLGLYVGWEGVGLASYLLIGFWYHKPSAATAAKKAFVVNRVGDIGLAIAMMVMFATFGTISFAGVFGATRLHERGRADRDSACCCCSPRAASPPRFRCSPGSVTRWKAPLRCRR